MRAFNTKLSHILAASAITLVTANAALADDSEIYLGGLSANEGVRPNILFIVDTSGSMSSIVDTPKPPYNPAETYVDRGCSSGRVYWRLGSGSPPACSSTNRFPVTMNNCAAATSAFAASGSWTGKAAMWNSSNSQRSWQDLRGGVSTEPVECEVDAGLHGPNSNPALIWAKNGSNTNKWSSVAPGIGWSARSAYTLYTSNWLNWYYAPASAFQQTRLEVVQEVATNLANSIDGVNLGLMRYSNNGGSGSADSWAEGGMIKHAVENIATSRAAIVSTVNSFNPAGWTPLSETLYEAGQYFQGRNVDYGLNSREVSGGAIVPSVLSSRLAADPSRYRSPIEYACQKNHIIYLTDGLPTQDNSADAKIESQIGKSCTGTGSGRCLDDMAEYLYQQDLNPNLAGKQNVVTHTIGFGPDISGDFLDVTATKGGGQSYTADNVANLTVALQNIVSEILNVNVTFTAPTISINAFNRARTLDDLYVSVFSPDERVRWFGNLKKYRLSGNVIVDANNSAAVDPATGFIREGARSFWSVTPDGPVTADGGAASRLPAHASRNVYTSLSGADLSSPANRVARTNTALTDAVLGISGIAGDPTRDEVIDWVRGRDVKDEDADSDTTETRRAMGDPMHTRPAVVTYGGTTGSPDAHDAVIFVPTNEGLLHAINVNTGDELWAFAPAEMLPRFVTLFDNAPAPAKNYGIDGDVSVVTLDLNLDGVISASAGDKVYAYFGLRRGGSVYYGLDVTDRNNPRLLWRRNSADLPGLGEAWSTPLAGRVIVQGAAQNAEHLVLVLSGGYDPAQENYNYVADTVGKRLFMIDAISGAVLWYAGDAASSANLRLSAMTNSIPANVTPLDTTGDGFLDRIYAADTGGQVWRFDIFNNQPASSLVTGGVIARLGAAGVTGATIADTRRFYNAPDVALIARRLQAPYYNIAIGSGYRGHPLHTATRDRFYSIRDKRPFERLTQLQYDAITPVLDGGLINITDSMSTPVPSTAAGWKLELRASGGWSGEKVLADSVTVNNVILFPTYEPVVSNTTLACGGAVGFNRAYALRVDDGDSTIDFNNDGVQDLSDRSQQLAQSGIAPEVAVSFTLNQDPTTDPDPDFDGDGIPNSSDPDDDNDGIPDDQDNDDETPPGGGSVCKIGLEVLSRCVRPEGTQRSYWRRPGD
jgi:type IV pilus assembly protein PilY1